MRTVSLRSVIARTVSLRAVIVRFVSWLAAAVSVVVVAARQRRLSTVPFVPVVRRVGFLNALCARFSHTHTHTHTCRVCVHTSRTVYICIFFVCSPASVSVAVSAAFVVLVVCLFVDWLRLTFFFQRLLFKKRRATVNV